MVRIFFKPCDVYTFYPLKDVLTDGAHYTEGWNESKTGSGVSYESFSVSVKPYRLLWDESSRASSSSMSHEQ